MNEHISDGRTAKSPQRHAPSGGLTMLTVCVQKHYNDLQRHIKMIDRLNVGVDWHLVIIDNSDSHSSQFRVDDPRVEIRPGVPLDLTKSEDVRSSYHHGSALTVNLKDIRDRFLLVIDPDLFVVYPNWIRETTEH